MSIYRRIGFVSWMGLALALGGPAAAGTAESSDGEWAKKVLDASGVQGGIVVHLGCGDGRRTLALRAQDQYTVLGLDGDAAVVDAARRRLVKEGVYGPVSIDRLRGSSLPYCDNLVNMVVVEDERLVSDEEIMRVLAPRGVACFPDGEGWRTLVKPWPETIDEWSHFLHDAGNNAVAQDELVGPPRSLQWVAPPLWLRSHETPSGIESLVSSGGRIYYFFDEGLVGITDQRLPERWSLIARDAFNGKLLWKRPVEPWGWPQWADEKFAGIPWTEIRGGRTVVPEENQRRLVASGDRLYATLGYRAPLAILDGATGETITTVAETEPVDEILVSGGIALIHSREPASGAAKRRGEAQRTASRLIAVDGQGGKVLWTRETEQMKQLLLGVADGRVIYQAADKLVCLQQDDGSPAWQADAPKSGGKTLIVHNGVVLLYTGSEIIAWDAAGGSQLWRREVPPSSGSESGDLFVAQDLVWRGMVPVDEKGEAVSKSADAMAVGYDLKTGEEKRRILADDLRSPEHHHRCYRNKATERFIISGMEGAEFMDLNGEAHSQNNFLRGACKLGVMPCNGLLYVPADQCFCQPGAKLLGFAAVAANSPSRQREVADAARLEKGPAFAPIARQTTPADASDWPTFRHDAARHGASTAAVPPVRDTLWTAELSGRLTQPVVADGRLLVASCDAHTVFALDALSGKSLWSYVAGGRIDSPPTLHEGQVLFGSADGWVYCLRASDGTLAWRFLAAPADVRIGYFDQTESAWPVHGSVLVRNGVAYVAAGRSTYLDGGIRLYGLDVRSGQIRYRATVEGPFPDDGRDRELGFYIEGANSDVLVSEGDYIYMRQKRFTFDLREVDAPALSDKGEKDIGLHVFSTAGLLDDSGYNRTFWMYAKRWPGFQLANQAPKSGQLLVVDDENTYAVNPFYRRNVHSPLFFPAKEGYLLFADRNSTEPQIVGEPGAKEAVEWLPQSHIPRDGNPGLESVAFGLDKMIGYTRAELPLWSQYMPIRITAMVKAGTTLFVAGVPDELASDDPYAAFEGRRGARLAALAARDGARLAETTLACPPVFDGMIAAAGRLYISLQNGQVVCLGAK